MRWFRRHRRYLLAGVVVMLMVAWGVLGTVQRLVSRDEPPLGVVRGEEVTAADGREAAALVRIANALGFFSPMTLRGLQYSPGSVEAKRMVAALGMTFFPFLEAAEGSGEDAPWRTIVLLREAEAAGIQVTDEEARDLLKMSPVMMGYEGFSTDNYRLFRQSYGLSDTQMARIMHRIAQIAKLLMIRRDGVRASRAEWWAEWVFSEEQLKLALVAVDAEWFQPFVAPTDADLKAYYEEHKDKVPDEAAGVIGFKAPERVRIEYAVADPGDFAFEVEVSDEEIADYYEQNRDSFAAEETEEAGTEGEPAAADEAESTEDAGVEEEPEPQYQPLEAVADDIRAILVEEKGREAAREAVRQVMSALEAVSPDYANERQPLAQMARRYGLEPVVAETEQGRQLLSRREVAELVPQGMRVAQYAFEEPEVLYFAHLMDEGSPPLVCQVIEKREPEVLPYEEVEEQAREWYIEDAALERAETFAQKILEAAKDRSLQEAAEEMDGRLRNLLGLPEDGESLLEVKETGFFTRGARGIPGVAGNAAPVAARAFSMAEGEVSLVTAGAPDYHCYVITAIDRKGAAQEEFTESNPMMRAFYIGDKQQRVLDEWLGGLLAAAEPNPLAFAPEEPSESED